MDMDTFANKKIAIIGSGHMARALVEGLAKSGKERVSRIVVSNLSGSGLEALQGEFGVQTKTDNTDATRTADWIFIAVKPLTVKSVIEEIAEVTQGKLVISLAAGVTMELLKRYVGINGQRYIRIMPNIPIGCNTGVIGLYADIRVPRPETTAVCSFLRGLGKVIEVQDEKDLDTITLVAGCGPAIVAHCIEMISRYGVLSGLSEEMSRDIALQTFQGTIAYLGKAGLTPRVLEQSVATRGGVTEEILNSMNRLGVDILFHQSLDAGYAKIKALQEKLYGNV
ncbi:pyrroline-5-carboxylate reductase [Candidatus Gottesmanbacteria bacterium]|nr:pyrroline-5-carboxylate reductase [Candidatus Gottesmanbacteria bacterium]